MYDSAECVDVTSFKVMSHRSDRHGSANASNDTHARKVMAVRGLQKRWVETWAVWENQHYM